MLNSFRRRFWNFVHDRLEDAWHWVWMHKLYDPKDLVAAVPVNYTFIYGRSAAPAINLPADKPSTENEQEG